MPFAITCPIIHLSGIYFHNPDFLSSLKHPTSFKVQPVKKKLFPCSPYNELAWAVEH